MEDLKKLQDDLWDYAETGFKEYKSAEAMCKYLEKKGFEVNRGICNMDTAFDAVYGSGKPVIAILAEYDALDGMSQEADVAEYKPLKDSTTGQGCGHHLLGVGAINAFLELKKIIDEENLEATIKLVGCPAEEAGSGKTYLARDGYFDDVDIALTWHPSNISSVSTGSHQACIQCYFRFKGVSSHAAGSPELGRSALDAVELTNIGVNYLREHIRSDERIHYAITNTGGHAPNVVQAEAEVRYFVRSSTGPRVKKLYERVCNVARGAALMNDTELEIIFDEGLVDIVPNFTLEKVFRDSFIKLGVPKYTEEEREYAKKFKDTYDVDVLLNQTYENVKDVKKLKKNIIESELNDYFVDKDHSDVCYMGSSDVGDVSWVVPTAQINVNCFSYGASGHSWQWVAQGKSSISFKGAIHAGIIIADTARTLIKNPNLIEKAKEELKERLGDQEYECLIPKDVLPHVY